jgi:hypothetical protein
MHSISNTGIGKPPKVRFCFDSAKGFDVTIEFSIFTESYVSVKKRYPELPDETPRGWNYLGSDEKPGPTAIHPLRRHTDEGETAK